MDILRNRTHSDPKRMVPAFFLCAITISFGCLPDRDNVDDPNGTNYGKDGYSSPMKGFGDICYKSQSSCSAGLDCISINNNSKGFCTPVCTIYNSLCNGSKSGQYAKCFLPQPKNTIYCIPFCKVDGKAFNCPPGFTCTPSDYNNSYCSPS